MINTPELQALRDVCARLDGAHIAYMLTGSVAMSYYATPRMTRDIDLVLALEATPVSRLVEALGPDYHVDADALRAALKNERPWNIFHFDSIVKIDFIPRKNTVYRLAEFARRHRASIAGIPLWIVSIEDLILSKLEWSKQSRSEQQRRDIATLLGEPHDAAYLREWAESLGLQAALGEIQTHSSDE